MIDHVESRHLAHCRMLVPHSVQARQPWYNITFAAWWLILLPEFLSKHSNNVLVLPEPVLVVVAAADVVGYPNLNHLQGSPHTGLVLGAV